MKRNWIIKDLPQTAELPGLPRLISRLLVQRGISTESAALEFLNPDYSRLFDPFLFSDMGISVERVWKAIDANQRIFIYADYDADAITAASVMFLALRKLGANAGCYIPDRFSEGYGINVEAIRKLKEQGAELVISVDCGINSREEALEAKKLGMDLIITDHHELVGELPEAFAVINPKNPMDNYPFPFLTGVGVAFKLVQGLFSKEEKLKALGLAKGWEKWLLDLVSIGTVADCQELTSENRLLVHFGLKVMGKTRWSGLKALIETAGCSGRLDTYSIGFMIAPRINAAGRIKHADLAFKLLVTEDPAEAFKMANELNDLNRHRQMLTDQILSEARAQLELLTDRKILMAAGLNWPKGVVGLVAGRLAEEFNRPVLVLDKSEEFATGSGRSVSSFDLVSALNFSKDLLLKYGGHKQAAGFTLSVQNVDLFYKRLLEHADAVNLIQSDPELHIDSELSADEIGEENFDLIEKLGPFGFGNPRPKFVSYGLKLLDSLQVGSQRQHAKLRIEYGGKAFSAIAFNQPFLSANLSNKPFDAAFELSQNEWNGQRQIELKIIDTKIHG